ncbi:lariat debranching enzyme [Nicotiana attenuata]|uniref:Lariat debranching enzyme n=1 Tax=Nicotiana attenuata TaxID=49451 RepID=A0A1J6IN37_NICAT|nr:lariat debranching enzyme [Nicotiana attenuata]
MRIAVEGCMHGDLDNVYATLLQLQEVENIKIDLLLCCGDFQAVRNEKDLESLNVPLKYRSMNSFWKYYSGEKVAPFPTIFIGGNHEASNYLWELYYGGWAAPQIYFLGFAGVIKFGNIRIGGLSGIYKSQDYNRAYIASTCIHRIWKTSDGVPVTLTRNSDENIELCRFGTKPFLFTAIQKGEAKMPMSVFTVIEVKKMEISSLHRRVHLGTNITSLEFLLRLLY